MDTTMRRFVQSSATGCRASGQLGLLLGYKNKLAPSVFPSSCGRTVTCASMSTTAAMTDISTFDPHFVVVSLGNPPPHGESLHSAGHVAVQALQREVRLALNQPNFESQRIGKKATQVSRSPKYTLLQSPTTMNVSGPWVAKAWAELHSEVRLEDPERPLGLIVVHDELEEDMCIVKIRRWERSHRGHNGLKSTQASVQHRSYPGSKFAKISVGIGRPEGRDHDTVSNYVLKPWSKYQKQTLFEKTGQSVLAALKQIEATWKEEIEKSTVSLSNSSAPPTRNVKK